MNIRRLSVQALEVVAVFVLVSLILGQLFGQPLLLGFVETDSMSPTLEPGAGFVAVPTAVAGPIEEGDVVSFRAQNIGGGEITTHRVVGRSEAGFITRGDANSFTDQQGVEPPVPRDRVVAVALQVNGEVVVVPGLGVAVGWSQDLIVSAVGLAGIDTNPQRLAVVLLAVTIAALFLDEHLDAGDERTRHRSTDRAAGYDTRPFLVAGVAFVIVVATLSMVLASGAATFEFDSVSPDEAAEGGVVAGTTTTTDVRVSNGGLLPAVVFLEASGDPSSATDGPLVLGPHDNVTVNVSVTAPIEPGRYEQTVVQRRYIGVLPVSTIAALHEVDPWLAIAAIDALLLAVLGSVGRVLVGRGRVRTGRGRTLPVDVTVRRFVRRLYR